MDKPFSSYDGNDPYIFVSYSHQDSGIVYPSIQWLREQGFNIWYDEGISPGASWREELAEAILKCDLFIILISPQSANSSNCLKEVNFALEHNRQVLAIHQEPTTLSPGLQLALSDRQAIFRHELTDDQYRDKILSGVTKHISPGATRVNVASPAPIKKKPSKTLLVAVVAVVIVITAFIVAIRNGDVTSESATPSKQPQPTTSAPAQASTPNKKVRSNWVAVLPFTTLSNSEEMKGLADGLTTQTIIALGPMNSFSVVPYRNVASYTDKKKALDEISRALDARYLLDGRIQSSGDKTRISVELLDGVAGQSLWQDSQTFEGDDYLAMQDAVTRQTSIILSSRLEGIESQRLASVPSTDMDANELYYKASRFWLNPNQVTLATAIANLRRSLVLEPDHPGAMASLSQLLAQSAELGGEEDLVATRAQVCELANRTLEVGTGASVTVVYPLVDVCGEPAKAVQFMERIISLNPEAAGNWAPYSYALTGAGRFDEALAAIDRAQSLDRNALWVRYLVEPLRAIVYIHQDDWDMAVPQLIKALNDNPSLFWIQIALANGLGLKGDYEGARAHWSEVKARFPKATIDGVKWYYAAGYTDELSAKMVEGLQLAKVDEME